MFLSRWRPRHLLASWIAYWIALPFIALAPALPVLWRVSGAAQGQGNIGVSFGDTGWVVTVAAGADKWVGHTSSLEVALWVGLPPLLMWIAWMASRPRAGRHLENISPARALHAQDPHRAGDAIIPSKADERR
jgi:hypothetical protein